jgi:phage-related baseplate assembly protein
MPTPKAPIIEPPDFTGTSSDLITSVTGVPDYGLPFVPDIDFAVKDPAIIIGEVVADYEAAFKALTGIAKTLAPGDPVRLFLLVVCHWLSHQRTIIDFTGKMNLLKYAHDTYLDNIAALYGARALRLPAQAALTTLRFTLTAPLAFNATIPKGTLCQAPNGVVFATLVAGVIPSISTQCDVAAQASVAGAIGNNFAPGQINSVINWNQPFGVSVENTTLSAGGSDAENDEQYRYRIWLAIESFSTCGPREAYEFWALSAHPDIIQCVVHSAPEIAGEVWLYPLLKNGVLPSSEILQKVQDTCSAKDKRPVTDFVTALIADEFTYTLNVNYWVLKSNAVLLESIQAAVTQAAHDWILWQRSAISRDITGDELIKRMLEAGAKRVEIISPSPEFQVMLYNQLAVHDPDIDPIINFVDVEDI